MLLAAAVSLGLYLGWLYLKRERRPALVPLHLLLGAAGLQTTLLTLRGAPNGDSLAAGTFGTAAACLLGAAMFSGLMAPMLCRSSHSTANVVVATHVGVGLLGVALFLAWILLA